MSRNSAGTYTAPTNSFNPAVEGATIDEGDWNTTLDDLEQALTDSLDRTGKGKVTAHIDFDENASPGTPSANVGRLYVADVGGVTTLKFKDAGGTDYNLLLTSPGLAYTFSTSTTTTSDPGSGIIRFNNATLSSVTEIAIDDADANGADLSAYILTWDDQTGTARGNLIIQNRTAPANVVVFRVSGSSTDETGWTRLSVTYVTHNGSFAASAPLGVTFAPSGATGLDGVSAGLLYQFSTTTTTSSDPGAGYVRFNNATLSSVTEIAVDDASANSGNPDVSAFVLTWDDSTSTIRGTVTFKKATALQNYAIYNITGASTDETGWTRLAVTYVGHNGSFSNNDQLGVEFVRTGNIGSTGATGSTGSAGTNGTDPGIRWLYDSTTTTSTDPGTGDFRLNSATLSSVTELAISYSSGETGNPSVENFVKAWDDSTTTGTRGTLIIKKASAPQNFAIYTITSAITDGTTYGRFTLSHVASSGSWTNGDTMAVQFIRTGDKGTDGAGAGDVVGPSSSVDSEIALFSSTTGKLLKRASTTGLLKAASGVLSAAVSGTDYAPATSGSSILKGNGSGGFSAASAGTDYYNPGGTDVSLADGGTGASLTNPNADRILFWDDSAGQVTWLTAGSGLAITGTTLTASGSIGGSTGSTDNAILRADGTGGATIQSSTPTIADDGGIAGIPSMNTGPLAGLRNRLINGCMRINQRASSSNADDTYAHDRWNILTQTGTVAVTTQTDAENTTPHMMRITQSQASAQRFGVEQIIESVNCKDLRGQAVTLSARVRMSASTTLRYAILEWTGTADTVTSDFVLSWTSTTFTAGNFFTSTSTTVTATGSTALTANTLTTVSLSATISSSANNVVAIFWTDSTQAQNVTLDIGKVQLEHGSTATVFERIAHATALVQCLRYTFVNAGVVNAFYGSGGAFSSTLGAVCVQWPVPMRTTPTVSYSAVSDWNVRNFATNTNAAMTADGGSNVTPVGGALIPTVASGLTTGGAITYEGANSNARIFVVAEL